MEISPINEFRIFAHGVAFDPDAYLATTGLKFDGVWHKHELNPNHPKSSGIFKILGDGPTLPIYEQERIAVEYLTANRDALSALAYEPTVTTFVLGLHYQVELEEGTVGFAVGSCAPLMSIALEIGIAPIYYVLLKRRDSQGSNTEDHHR